MYRPSKRYFESRGYLRLAGSGYYWYWLKKAESLSKSRLKTNRVWVEDGDRIYYACPNCGTFTKSYCAKDGNRDCMINGRDIDSIQCEACSNCSYHHWMTFADAVSRKVAGAIHLRPKKCPFCKSSTVKIYDHVAETNIYDIGVFYLSIAVCQTCQRHWRLDLKP